MNIKIRLILTTEEYNLLNKLASKTGMDCWFMIASKEGSDWVYDIENGRFITLRYGVGQLFDGLYMAYERKNLTDDEFNTMMTLAEKLKLPMPQLI